MERFRVESTERVGILRVVHEGLELNDSDGAIVVSWAVEFPSPVQGSVDLLQCEAGRRVLTKLTEYVESAERALAGAHPLGRSSTNGTP